MKEKSNVVMFRPAAFSAASSHKVTMGGEAMEIKHTHPDYTDENERMLRLKELSQLCLEQVRQIRKQSRTA